MGKKSKKIKHAEFIMVENMHDYSNDPTIIKRGEEAIEFLKKVGMPKWYTKKYGEPNFSIKIK